MVQLPDFVMATENSLESVVHINSKEIEDQYYKYYDPFLEFLILINLVKHNLQDLV